MSRHGSYPTAQKQTKNPWSGGHSESLSSSASSQTYHVIPPNHYVQVDPCWEGDVGWRGRCPPEAPPLPHGLATAVTPTGVYLVPKPLPPQSHQFASGLESTGRRSRPLSSGAATPVSGGYGASETAVLPCGGHCVALETFCHHLLQVAFVAGILTGICLVVAGSALKSGRGRRGPDLSVLTYIGAMVSLVSGLLLAIQCCSRPRTRNRRYRTAAPSVSTRAREEIPLQPMQPMVASLPRHQQNLLPHHFESGRPAPSEEVHLASDPSQPQGDCSDERQMELDSHPPHHNGERLLPLHAQGESQISLEGSILFMGDPIHRTSETTKSDALASTVAETTVAYPGGGETKTL